MPPLRPRNRFSDAFFRDCPLGHSVKPLLTHRFTLDDIEAAYELFANQPDGVLEVAIAP